MRRALLAGCGYLGQALANLLHNQGLLVTGWTRTAEAAATLGGKPYAVYPVDLSDQAEVEAQPDDFEVVVHCASTRGGDADSYRRTYFNGVRNLAKRFSQATLLFTGSTSVYAQCKGEWVTEESPAEPSHERGRILRETEDFVLEHGGIVARLAGLYGPDRSALLARVLSNRASIGKDRFVNQVHRDDAADALAWLIGISNRRGETFNVADNEPLLLSECYAWLAARLDHRWPLENAEMITTVAKRGDSNKRVSNAKMRATGWAPAYPSFRDGMTRSVLERGVYAVPGEPQV